MNFGFKEEMGFEVDQVKTLFVAKPRLWLMSKYCSLENEEFIVDSLVNSFVSLTVARAFKTWSESRSSVFLRDAARSRV